MDLKIHCPCGQKFAFEVEPVNGEMPQAVTCPACGADCTPQANALIRSTLNPSAPTPTPVVRIRVAPTLESAAPAAPAVTLTGSPPPPPPPPVPPGRPRPVAPVAVPVAEEGVDWFAYTKEVIGVILVAGLLFYGCVRRVQRVSGLGSHSPATLVESTPWSLPHDDGTMLLIKGTNDTAVAQFIISYWSQHQKGSLTAVRAGPDLSAAEKVRFIVHSPQNGVIEVTGPLFWEEADAVTWADLAQQLSQALSTMTVSASMGDDAESGRFAIFENGQRRFACDRRVRLTQKDFVEDVKLDGQPWAVAKGYQPREGDWKTFTMYDADGLVQHLGFKPVVPPETEIVTLLRDPSLR